MAYQLIPQPNDKLSISQNDLKQNFITANDVFAANHTDFLTGTGKHKFLQMPEQVVAPTTVANEAGLYSAVGAISAVSELVFRRENNGITIAFTESVNNASGWTRLPSGILLQWGTFTVQIADTVQTYTIPFPTACYSVQLTEVSSGTNHNFLTATSINANQINFLPKAYTQSGNRSMTTAMYFAIGV